VWRRRWRRSMGRRSFFRRRARRPLTSPVVFGPSQNQEAYVVMVGSMPVGDPAPPLHRHPHTDEAFYIAEGQLTFHLGDRELVAGAGAFVFIPRGLVHTAWNSGSGPMRGLLLLSPGGAEHIFQIGRDRITSRSRSCRRRGFLKRVRGRRERRPNLRRPLREESRIPGGVPRLNPRLRTTPAYDSGARTAGCDCRQTARF
jgi:quercetin dioxygenase-like cupin family protein